MVFFVFTIIGFMWTRKHFALCTCFIMVFGFIVGADSVRSSATHSVSFINVGQGDSALLRDGNGFDVLIDGGKRGASAVILTYLRALTVTDLDVVVATHPDADHVGGLIGVLAASDIPVLKFLYNGCESTTITWNDLKTAVANEGLAMETLRFPAVLNWGAMTVHVLNPSSASGCRSDTNQDSLVLRVDYGSTRYLFTGDIDAAIEATVIARQTPVAAQVLKVSHHGSASSSSAAFLSAVNPRDSVISTDGVSYGHPSADTVERLRQAGSIIWRTDRSGTLRVESDGSTYLVIPEFELHAVYAPLILNSP